jgi:hypothetical protein
MSQTLHQRNEAMIFGEGGGALLAPEAGRYGAAREARSQAFDNGFLTVF